MQYLYCGGFSSTPKNRVFNTPGRIRTCDLRIRNPLNQNDKLLKSKELQTQGSGAYKPAYKDNPKIDSNQDKNDTQNLPPDLAEIVALWLELPGHIKAAIKALVQTYNKGIE